MRPRALVWTDSPSSATGYGVVVYNILKELENFADVDCVLMGWDMDPVNESLKKQGKEPFRSINFYPTKDNSGGAETIQRMIQSSHYDYLILNNDFARIDNLYQINNFKDYFPKPFTVAYGAIDHIYGEEFVGRPVNEHPQELRTREETLNCINRVIPTAQYGYNYFKKYFDHKGLELPILYGLDFTNFKPLARNEKNEKRKYHFGDWVKDDEILLINLNRNTARKDILGAMLIFYEVWKKNPICKYYIHTNPTEQNWHLFDLAINAGVDPADINRGIYKFSGEHNILNGGVPEPILAEYMAMSDLNFNTGMGEGTGLSNYEALACKNINLIPSNTGMIEIPKIELPSSFENYWYWPGANPHICKKVDHKKAVEVVSDVVRSMWVDYSSFDQEREEGHKWIQQCELSVFRSHWREFFAEIIK